MTEAEIDALRAEVEALREELTETNQGVVALTAELEARTRALEELDRRKSHFLAALAHELRNPLAVIRLALDDVSPDDRAALLRRNVDHVRRLVDDLLDISRIERARIELAPRDVDLGRILRRTVEDARTYLEQSGTRVVVREPGTPTRVFGDPTRLAQVITNLLDNAVKYSPAGSVVEVALEADAERVELSVTDQGRGLADGEHEAIFELFEQGDSSLGRDTGGLGIGLTLVRSLVELHGGRVHAESAGPGRGARFVVTLPPLASREDADLASDSSGTQSAEPPQSDAAMRVLLVEDGDDLRALLAHRLRAHGLDVATAESGPRALEWLSRSTCDVVVADLGMPGMTGFDLAREVRARYPDILLVALSGHGSEQDRRATAQAGFVAHLVKPVAIEDVLGVLRETSESS